MNFSPHSPQGRRPDCSPESELTLDELDAIFTAFLDQYHHQVNVQTGNTPLAHWHNQIVPEHMAPDRAEELLKGSVARRVGKLGIAYAGRKYWHEDLTAIVGRGVIIRVDSHGALPSSIDVFYQNQWFCSAFLNASKEA